MATENKGEGDYLEDIMLRSEGNHGAKKVLNDIYKKEGSDIYDMVAPNLGKGSEIWLKYKDECREDLEALIEKYLS